MRKKVLSCIVAVALLLAGCASQTSVPEKTLDRTEYSPMELSGKEFVSVADNGALELLCNPATSEVAVKVKSTGKTYYTNPVQRTEDALANQANSSLMSSQLVLTYANDSNQVSEINNYDLSIANGQFSFYQLENGIKIDYLMQEVQEEGLMPQACTEEDFEENILPRFSGSDVVTIRDSYGKTVMSEITAERRSEILSLYPNADEYEVIYVLFDSVKNQKLRRLNDAFEEAGFTVEEKSAMEEKVGRADVESAQWFTASLEYRLDGDNLVVSLPAEDLRAGEGYLITDVTVLPFFGAGYAEEDGYLLVPDGSGAIVDFAENPTVKTPVTLSYYGADYSMLQTTDPEIRPAMRLPIYGIKAGDQAFLAILEEGAPIASLEVNVAGQTSQYHSLQVGFNVLGNSEMQVQGFSTTTPVRVYQETPYQGNCTIRYAFLSGEETRYSDMAAYYRDYLINSSALNQVAKANSYPFYVNMLCAIDKTMSMMGIPIDQTISLTSFDQASAILDELQAEGVDNTVMTLSGWNQGGVRGSRPSALRPDNTLGGLSALEDLLTAGEEQGADIYLDWNGSYFSEQANNLLDTFVASWHGAASISQKTSFKREYSAADSTSDNTQPWWYVYSPEYKRELASSFLSDLDRLDVCPGIALNWEGYDLNSDFNSDKQQDRVNAMENDSEILANFAERTAVMANGTNAYALPYANFIQNVPLCSSGQTLYSYDIPFYQMVVHGSIPYASISQNVNQLDLNTFLLKLLETGSSPAYFWTSSEDSILKDSSFNNWYSLNAENWMDSALEVYQEAENVLAPLADMPITDHVRLEEDVYCVTYGETVKIYINYTSSPVTAERVTIQPASYEVVSV